MAWATQVPWHGLGVQVPSDVGVDEMLRLSGLNWTVEKRAAYVQTRNGFEVVPDQYHLVRSTDETVLTTVGKSYTPVQNAEAFEFFREFVEAGDMRMETAGSLNNGRRIWALAAIRDGFSLDGDDEVRGYLMFTNPHVAGFSLLTQFTPIRVVCANTLAMALDAGGVTSGTAAYRHPHFTKFDPQKAKEVMGIARFQLATLREQATFLAKKRYNETTVRQFFVDVFEPGKSKAAANDSEKMMRLLDLPRVKDAVRYLTEQPGADLPSAAGTWWGAYNTITYMADHIIGRNADTRLVSSWFGEYRQFKLRALDRALEYAQAA